MDSLAPEKPSPFEPELRYYSKRQVAAAAALAGPLAGGWLLSRNLTRSGNAKAAQHVVVLSSLVTLALAALVFYLPTDFPKAIIPAVDGLAFDLVYRRLFAQRYAAHIEKGGRKASSWKAAGISLATIPAFFAAAAVLALGDWIQPSNQVPIGNNFVVYEGSASRQDAERLGGFLAEWGVKNQTFVIYFPRGEGNKVIFKAQIEPPAKGSDAYAVIQAMLRESEQRAFPNRKASFQVQNTFGLSTMTVTDE